MRIGILATRPLCGRMIGRKQVLRTMMESMELLGHEVLYLPIARKGHRASCSHCIGTVLQAPSPPQILWNAITKHLAGSFCLNECLFWNSRQVAIARRLLATCDIIIVDMLRMAPYTSGLDRPIILDLDDLLSKRYSQWAAQQHGSEQILGYYRDVIGRRASGMLSAAARRSLRIEARAIARREDYWARRADAVCLVSSQEAADLAARIDRPVFAVPMSVDLPDVESLPSASSQSLVFLGGLDFQPNIQALRYYRDHVRPALCDIGLESTRLHVLGFAPDKLRAEFEGHHMIFEGYVDHLGSALRRHRLFVAPITQGTGIKTKVLEAMAHEMAVVGTSNAFQGLRVTDGIHCLMGRDPAEFARRVAYALNHPAEAEQIGRAGRQYVQNGYTRQQVAGQWRDVLDAAQSNFIARSTAAPRVWKTTPVAATA